MRTRTLGNGHVFQQRFWSDPIRDEYHFLTALRYIEANPVTGNLVTRAERWPWSSLALRDSSGIGLLDSLPLSLPPNWIDVVNEEGIEGQPL
jgi:putative transposase